MNLAPGEEGAVTLKFRQLFGTLFVRSPMANATVSVDGETVGKTSAAGLTVPSVAFGERQITATLPGYRLARSQTVTVSAERSYTVDLAFVDLPGEITVSRLEPGTRFYLDGVDHPKMRNGQATAEAAAGGHTLRLETATPYFEKIVTIQKGEKLSVIPGGGDWKPILVAVALKGCPRGSTVAVDGSQVSKRTDRDGLSIDLTVDKHQITVSNSDTIYDPALARSVPQWSARTTTVNVQSSGDQPVVSISLPEWIPGKRRTAQISIPQESYTVYEKDYSTTKLPIPGVSWTSSKKRPVTKYRVDREALRRGMLKSGASAEEARRVLDGVYDTQTGDVNFAVTTSGRWSN